MCELKTTRSSGAHIPPRPVHTRPEASGYGIRQSSERGFSCPFSSGKKAATSHLAHCEKPLINLFKQAISLIYRQRLHFLCFSLSFLTLQPFSLVHPIVCAPSCIQPAPLPEGRSASGNGICGQLEQAVMQSFQWLCPLSQV